MTTTWSAPGLIETLYIVGAGGHGRELLWLSKEIYGDRVEIRLVVERPSDLPGSLVNGTKVGLITDMSPGPGVRYVVGIGNPAARYRIAHRLDAAGYIASPLVHPEARISEWASIGAGAVVCAGVVITTNVAVAPHAHVNIGCTISHDVSLAECATLSPGVHVAGNVTIGRRAFLGIGAAVTNGAPMTPLVVGDDAVIGAGACVIRSVAPGSTVVGVPAVPLTSAARAGAERESIEEPL